MKKIKTYKTSDLNLKRAEILDSAVKSPVRLVTQASRHPDREDLAVMSWAHWEKTVRKGLER